MFLRKLSDVLPVLAALVAAAIVIGLVIAICREPRGLLMMP